ncbi:MAG: phosphate signaling complex protein PhoU [Lachnospiraceae bacterium]|nr:phosphate signaling complex protein PhoU [Lachnospiraceae bacterium]
MREKYNKELKELNASLVEMGKLCKEAILKDVDALADEKPGDLDDIREVSDSIVKKQEDIENLCYRLILTEQPVASDLRNISSASKAIVDMQRIGVNALDIAEIVPYVADSPLKTQVPILMMADAASYMVSKSVEAFVDKNTELADSVIKYDDTVDDLYDEVKTSVIEAIRNNKKNEAASGIDILMIAKYFERMGDHAESIAHLVRYSLNQ